MSSGQDVDMETCDDATQQRLYPPLPHFNADASNAQDTEHMEVQDASTNLNNTQTPNNTAVTQQPAPTVWRKKSKEKLQSFVNVMTGSNNQPVSQSQEKEHGTPSGSNSQSLSENGNTAPQKQQGNSQQSPIDAHNVDIHRSEDEQRNKPAPPNTAEQHLSTSDHVGQRPSAPPDVTKVNIKVDWPDKLPDKWEFLLQKALQRWCNSTLSDLVKEDCTIVNLKPKPDSSEDVAVEISPSKALGTLKEMKTASVHFKDLKRDVTVHFMFEEERFENEPQVPNQTVDMLVNGSIDVEKFPAEVQAKLRKKFEKHLFHNKFVSVCGSLNVIENLYKAVCDTVDEEKTRQDAGAVKNAQPLSVEGTKDSFKRQKSQEQEVDMFVNASIDVEKFPAEVQAELRKKFEKFCVVNKLSVSGSLNIIQKFYEEVCEIVEEEKNRNAAGAVRNVSVQTEISGSTETSGVQQALTVPVPQHWDLQKEIRQIEHDCGVNISLSFSVTAKEMTTDSVHTAIEKLTELVRSNVNSVTPMPRKLVAETNENEMETENSGARSWAALETPINLEMDIKDTQASLEMDEIHWKLVQMAFEKQVSDIQHKYAVRFDVETSQGTKAKVRATSLDNSLVNLESHALRALTHLYQRVATSTVTCELRDTADSKTVAAVLDAIKPQHPCVAAGEQYGSWKLIGLPEHLLPAIADIEKLIGKPVFDDKAKQMLSYPGNFSQISRHTPGTGPGVQTDSDRSEFNRKQLEDKASAKGKGSEEDNCAICQDGFKDKKKLKCGHEFCKECLKMSEMSLGQICSLCKNVYGLVKGNQPPGTMTSQIWQTSLPGFSNCGTIQIDYSIPDGTQTKEHPNPGQRYHGAHRCAYLPNNKEGQEVLKLLKRAFDQRLIFTVGRSTTTGADNVVTWNDIHHKTSTHGGPERYGYPDPDYLQRVKAELKAKGIE